LLFVFVLLLAGGCGAPGEPTPPAPAVLVAINDLAAQQTGEAVQLTFTMPSKTVPANGSPGLLPSKSCAAGSKLTARPTLSHFV